MIDGRIVQVAEMGERIHLADTNHAISNHAIANDDHGMGTMPGAYPRTSTRALTATILPYVMQLAQKGVEALRQDHGFAKGVNTHNGYITCKPVAEAIGLIARFKDFSGT